MEALLTYIIKSVGLLILFYCAYYFLLRKETFFNSNRWFLLAGLFTSVVLPFIVYTKIVWIDPAPVLNSNYQIYTPQTNQDVAFAIDWNLTFILIYSIGFLALLIKFAIDFYSLNSVLKGKKIQQQADFKFIDIKENIAPFSYFDYIVYNSSLYSASELENIIEHEKVHSEQNHTIDVLISRVFCVLFWFNPFIWLYKKAILQNLEFIADNEAAQKISDKKAYQYTLLKITTHENCVAITNHFYQSLIKKRIIMLNKNQSKRSNSWKFYVVIPALIAFVLLFQVQVIAKEKTETKKEIAKQEIAKEGTKSVDVYKIKKTTTDQELKEIAEKLKLNHNVDFTVSGIERNSNNELTAIKVAIKRGSEENQAFSVASTKGIKDCGVVIVTDEDGSKKISLITDNQSDDTAKTDKKQKVEVKKVVQNSKTNTNVNTNSNTSTKTNNNTNDNTNVIVTSTSTGNTSTVFVHSNSDAQSNAKANGVPLYIIDGVVIKNVNKSEINALDIKSVSIFKGPEAIVKYGEEGTNGVIVIETKK